MSETAKEPVRPAWFDKTKHLAADNGIRDRKTGLFLAGDGLPMSGPARAAALAAIGATTDELAIVTDTAIATATAKIAHDQAAKKAAQSTKPSASSGTKE